MGQPLSIQLYSALHIYIPMNLHLVLLCRHHQRLPATEINRTHITLVFFLHVPFNGIRGNVWLVRLFRCSWGIFSTTDKSFVDIFGRKETGFQRQAKLFELHLFIQMWQNTFFYIVHPKGQSHPRQTITNMKTTYIRSPIHDTE